MAWIYLAESEDSPWHFIPGYDRLPIVKKTLTHNPSFCAECGAEKSRRHRSGMTCSLWKGAFFHTWTLSMADSHARMSALWALKKAWQESEAVFFLSWSGLQRKWGHRSFSWKTYREELKKKNPELPLPLRKLVTRRAPLRCPHSTLAPIKKGFAGFFWPTVTAKTYGFQMGGGSSRVGKIRKGFSRLLGGPPNPEFLEWLMGYPIGWTATEPWATQWCRSKRAKRSAD